MEHHHSRTLKSKHSHKHTCYCSRKRKTLRNATYGISAPRRTADYVPTRVSHAAHLYIPILMQYFFRKKFTYHLTLTLHPTARRKQKCRFENRNFNSWWRLARATGIYSYLLSKRVNSAGLSPQFYTFENWVYIKIILCMQFFCNVLSTRVAG